MPVVVVAGDITIDCGIGITRPARRGRWDPDAKVEYFRQCGGALLLAALVDEVKPAGWGVRRPQDPKWESESYHRSFARWELCDRRKDDTAWVPGGAPKRVWRVTEFLGSADPVDRSPPCRAVEHDDPEADVLVLIDSDLGFRDKARSGCWPEALTSGSEPLVVLRLTYAEPAGHLWTKLRRHRERLVVITSARDLRNVGARISRQISWERTAEDTLQEILANTKNKKLRALGECAHVIVSYGTAGALVLSRQGPGQHEAQLLFDPERLEGEWNAAYPGLVIGHTSCLTAAAARWAMEHRAGVEGAISLHDSVRRGVAAMRLLRVIGYGRRSRWEFPADKVAAVIDGSRSIPQRLARFRMLPEFVDELTETSGEDEARACAWTMLDETHDTDQLAEAIVKTGVDGALRDARFGFPVGRFEKLTTVDRGEIEALRNIRALIDDYRAKDVNRPLSIAVFGPPGAGKTFGVVQVATSVAAEVGDFQVEVREFNLSQFSEPEALHDALQQVRDVGLEEHQLPLVIWDEFDTSLESETLGWLRYFLAPMQDGHFVQGEITHPVGSAIFVFAGGTSASFASFASAMDEAERRAAKVPDFLSRLHGYLDVRGPNRIAPEPGPSPQPLRWLPPGVQPQVVPRDDRVYVVRRAVLLRAFLERHWPELVRHKDFIDSDVLAAFLGVESYVHGARSMESIVSTSRLAGETKFLQSSLPQPDQLELHVDPSFYRLALGILAP